MVLAAGAAVAVASAAWIAWDRDPMPNSVWVRVRGWRSTSGPDVIRESPNGAPLGVQWMSWRD